MLTKLKSGNLVNLDAVVAVSKANENWTLRLANGDQMVIEPEDLDLFNEPSGAPIEK